MDKYLDANVVFSKFCSGYMKLKKDLPIRPSEMGLLNIIVQREGPFTPLMIAELLEVSKPMITAHISALEKKGYIKREASKDDKRSFYVTPTEKAKELVEATSEKMRRKLCQIEAALGAETFDSLLRVLLETNKIMKNLEGEDS